MGPFLRGPVILLLFEFDLKKCAVGFNDSSQPTTPPPSSDCSLIASIVNN